MDIITGTYSIPGQIPKGKELPSGLLDLGLYTNPIPGQIPKGESPFPLVGSGYYSKGGLPLIAKKDLDPLELIDPKEDPVTSLKNPGIEGMEGGIGGLNFSSSGIFGSRDSSGYVKSYREDRGSSFVKPSGSSKKSGFKGLYGFGRLGALSIIKVKGLGNR